MADTVSERYLEHLTDGDLAVIVRAANEAERVGITADDLRAHPEQIERWLSHPALFRSLFPDDGPELAPFLSPFLLFLAVMSRVHADLQTATSVQEWVGPRQRLFVFDVEPLRAFLSAPGRRLFLAELLASYTHVASGAVRVRTRRGWRRRRISELNLVQLAGWAEVAPENQRAWVYRRLGDLALFLAGVFPDHVVRYPPLDGAARQRVLRIVRLEHEAVGEDDVIRLLEEVGRRCYEAALQWLPVVTVSMRPLQEVARDVTAARRVLNVAVDRYLLPQRVQWFPNWGA
jgi:hypothetical protein